jgi:hypothetical protein
MAIYKYVQFVTKSDDKAFDELHSPGVSAPYSGIYRCHVCGHEIAIAGGHILPPQNHHQHNPGAGQITWRLTVHPVSS